MSKKRDKKPSKVEKSFYSEKNFKLLKSVVGDMLAEQKKEVPPQLSQALVGTMENIFANAQVPKPTSREHRYELVQGLNKHVLRSIMQQIKTVVPEQVPPAMHRDLHSLPQNGRPSATQPLPFINTPQQQQMAPSAWNNGSGNNMTVFPPPPDSGFYTNISHNAPPVPPRDLPNVQNIHSPRNKPMLHPSQNIQEFSRPQPQPVQGPGANVGTALESMERERAEMFRRPQPKTMDFALPQVEELPDPEQRFQQMMQERQADVIVPPADGSVPHPASEYESSMTHGLDEQLLAMERVKDTPTSSFRPEDARPQYEQAMQHVQQRVAQIEMPVAPRIQSRHLEERYLILHSMQRDDKTQSPYEFNSFFTRPQQSSVVEKKDESGNILYQEHIASENGVSLHIFQDARSIECTDVRVPSTLTAAFEEPYLWLCVDEFANVNTGPGIPPGAFSRLYPIEGHSKSSFVTLHAQIPERHILSLDRYPSQVNIKLCRPNGEICSSGQDRQEVKEVAKEKNGENTVLVLNDTCDFTVGERVYLFTTVPEMQNLVEFHQSVFLYSLHAEKQKHSTGNFVMSFKAYTQNARQIENKIGQYKSTDKTKESLAFNDILKPGDFIFMECGFNDSDEKSTVWAEVIEIADKGSTKVLVSYPKTKKKQQIPKWISRLGFLRRVWAGRQEGDTLYGKEGVTITNISNNLVTVYHPYDQVDDVVRSIGRSLFLLRQNQQTSYHFRIIALGR